MYETRDVDHKFLERIYGDEEEKQTSRGGKQFLYLRALTMESQSVEGFVLKGNYVGNELATYRPHRRPGRPQMAR